MSVTKGKKQGIGQAELKQSAGTVHARPLRLRIPSKQLDEILPAARRSARPPYSQNQIIVKDSEVETIRNLTLRKKTIRYLLRDLLASGWSIRRKEEMLAISPPKQYSKACIRQAMSLQRQEEINRHRRWIDSQLPHARECLADGKSVDPEKIDPYMQLCQSKEEHDLFRLYRFYWSSPYSEYVGRRVRILIRDRSLPNHPVVGLAALGSSIIHISSRDDFIGWDLETRTNRIINMMDIYVLGSLPPYNWLLGSKLVAYMLASNELRSLYRNKYAGHITTGRRRIATSLVLLCTTSLFGKRTSIYNRLTYKDGLLYTPIGETKGYGSQHISDSTFSLIRECLERNGGMPSNRFGAGPQWRVRAIREFFDLWGWDSAYLLNHSYRRGVFVVPLATNWKEFLCGTHRAPRYFDRPLAQLVEHWKIRWLQSRILNSEVMSKVNAFSPNDFCVS